MNEAEARAVQDFETTLPVLMKHLPSGWERSIEPDTVDISHPTFCALGQVFGSWNAGLTFLKSKGVTIDQIPSLTVPENTHKDEYYSRYRRSTILWQIWLRERIAAPAAA